MGNWYEFWRRWLVVASAIFAVQSVGWALLGSFDPFGFYDQYAAKGFFGVDELPLAAKTYGAFILGPFGATTSGFFVLVWFLARHPIKRREKWSIHAVAVAVGLWFALDTGTCLMRQAYFNIWIVNIPCLAVLLPPIAGLIRSQKISA